MMRIKDTPDNVYTDQLIRTASGHRASNKREEKLIEQQIKRAQRYIPPNFNHKISLEVNQEIKRVIIKIIDSQSDKVIKVMPPVALQKVYASIQRAVREMRSPHV